MYGYAIRHMEVFVFLRYHLVLIARQFVGFNKKPLIASFSFFLYIVIIYFLSVICLDKGRSPEVFFLYKHRNPGRGSFTVF